MLRCWDVEMLRCWDVEMWRCGDVEVLCGVVLLSSRAVGLLGCWAVGLSDCCSRCVGLVPLAGSLDQLLQSLSSTQPDEETSSIVEAYAPTQCYAATKGYTYTPADVEKSNWSLEWASSLGKTTRWAKLWVYHTHLVFVRSMEKAFN